MKTIGDIWRESDNEQLAQNLLEVIVLVYRCLGIDDEDIDLDVQYNAMLKMFETEVNESEEVYLN